MNADDQDKAAAQEAARAQLPDIDMKRVRNGMIALLFLGLALFVTGFWLLGQAGDEALIPPTAPGHLNNKLN